MHLHQDDHFSQVEQQGWQIGEQLIQLNGHPLPDAEALDKQWRKLAQLPVEQSFPLVFQVKPPAPLPVGQQPEYAPLADSGLPPAQLLLTILSTVSGIQPELQVPQMGDPTAMLVQLGAPFWQQVTPV